MAIQTFKCDDTRKLLEGHRVPRWINIQIVAIRKLAMLNAAVLLLDLRIPPNNRLEALAGDRKGQYSIRVNEQWRVCFKWTEAGPTEVEIVDYH